MATKTKAKKKSSNATLMTGRKARARAPWRRLSPVAQVKDGARRIKRRVRARVRGAVRRVRARSAGAWHSATGTGTVATAHRVKGGGARVRQHTRHGRVVRAHTRKV